MIRVVADLGNSRLKCGRLAADGTLAEVVALAIEDARGWSNLRQRWGLETTASVWAVASVNPPVAARLEETLTAARAQIRWYRSAVEIPVRHVLRHPETTGVDRALAVWEAVHQHPAGQPGQVIMCGSAVTIERISADGVWQGGAILPGLGLSARALNRLTAQLPLVDPGSGTPAPLGAETDSALTAGLFWGAVGAIREILTRQDAGPQQDNPPWVVWTGGDAPALAPHLLGNGVWVRPFLVLEGLARLTLMEPGGP